MCKSVDGLNGTAGKMVDWAVTIARIAVIPLVVLGFVGWEGHEGRIDAAEVSLAGIESSRFTAKDGLSVWQKIADLQREIDVSSTVGGTSNRSMQQDIRDMKQELRDIKALIERFHMDGGTGR